MDKIQIVKFKFGTIAFPSSLYNNKSYNVGNVGLIMPRCIKQEIERLIQEFLVVCKFGTERVYLRLDLFVDPNLEEVYLLEINSRLVDGWGVGFSLVQAAQNQNIEEILADANRAKFPSFWHLPASNRVYQNDFDFTLREINKLGISVKSITDIELDERLDERIYYYGWDRPKNNFLVAPNFGYEIENKIHFARFSQVWKGKQVKIPLCYSVRDTAWEEIPRDRVIFKFCEKYGEDSEKARNSVLYPKEVGRGRFVRQCYERATIVAQDLIPTVEVDDKICQLILLTSGVSVIVGYIIWAPRDTKIITDAYEHGPLVWN